MSDIYKSATFKLTAWYLALVVAISLMFSGVVYHFATNVLAQSLTTQQARIYRAFPVFSSNPFFVHDNDIANASHVVLRNLAYFNVIVFIGAGFASYWLARRTLQPIQASNERQKRFVADASHELRTPLTALKMSAEVALMDTDLPKAELRAVLASNLEDAERLTALLNNLLRLSQLETENMRLTFTALTAAHLVERALSQTQERAKAKHIAIHTEVTDSPIAGEQDSLVQLLVILIDNAIKYSPEHTSITITSAHKDSVTTLSVADHGIGIEPSALVHVFDRFYRADKARTGNEGYGLGLSIAKHIADLHHGNITLTSAPGKGTIAAVKLPSEPISL